MQAIADYEHKHRDKTVKGNYIELEINFDAEEEPKKKESATKKGADAAILKKQKSMKSKLDSSL